MCFLLGYPQPMPANKMVVERGALIYLNGSMRILGHGVDIVEFASLRPLLDDVNNDFLNQTFSAPEIALLPIGHRRISRIAGQFAAKEAIMKALGTGFGDGVAFSDIEVMFDSSSGTHAFLTGGAHAIADNLGISTIMIAIGTAKTAAIASAIALGNPVSPQIIQIIKSAPNT